MCQYCEGKKPQVIKSEDDKVYLEYDAKHKTFINVNENECQMWYMPMINYCPMCGRKL